MVNEMNTRNELFTFSDSVKGGRYENSAVR